MKSISRKAKTIDKPGAEDKSAPQVQEVLGSASKPDGVIISPMPKDSKIHRLFGRILPSKKSKIIFASMLVLILATIAGVYCYWRFAPVITVDGTKISRSEYEDMKSRISQFYKYNKDTSSLKDLDNQVTAKMTEDQIILAEAKKRGITVSDEEVNKAYNEMVAQYKSEAQFEQTIKQTYNWTPELARQTIKVGLLKDKLQPLVLRGYDVTMLYVRYDMGEDELKDDPIAKPTIDKFYSQLLSGRTIDQVSSDPGCAYPKCITKQYDQINEATANSIFIKTKGEEWGAISKVTKVGSYTTVVRSDSGFYAIFRVNSISNGQFNTWEDFVSYYKKKYVSVNYYTKLIIASDHTVGSIKNLSRSIFRYLSSILNSHALAACPNKSYHPAYVYIKITDRVTGLEINGVNVQEDVNDYYGGCKTEYYNYPTDTRILDFSHPNDHSETTSKYIDKWVGGQHLKGDGWAEFILDGYNNHNAPDCHFHWNYSLDKPGYKAKLETAWGVANGTNEIWHIYMTPTNVEWGLEATSSVDKHTMFVGDTATFTHDIWNDGPDNMPDARDFTSQVDWAADSARAQVNWVQNPDDGAGVLTNLPRNASHTHKDVGEHIQARVNKFTATATGHYCQLMSYWPSAKQGDTLAGADATTEVCVDVVVPRSDPGSYSPVSTASGDFEKGQSDTPTFTVGVNYTPPCYQNVYGLDGVGSEVIGQITYTSGGITAAPQEVINCGPSVSYVQTVNADITTLNGPGLPLFDQRCTTATFTPDPDYPGVKMNLATGAPSPQCSQVNAYQVPYARFYGNDIYARTGDIFFNKNTNPGPGMTGGASAVQYAAIAFDTVNINTNVFKGISPDLAAKWYNGQAPASPYDDVIANLPGNPKTPPSNPMDINGSSVTDNTYYNQVGDLSLGSNGNHHRRITIHATGDIYITTQLALPPGVMQNIKTKSDLATAPVLLIVSDKNIYIAPNVDQIDAILVAKGTVYTCATSATLPARAYTSPANPGWESSCNKKLTINGAVAAQNISFARSVGTRLKGNVNEPYNQPQGINTAAEVINFPSYLYYATPFLNSSSDSGYQSIFNAAPLL